MNETTNVLHLRQPDTIDDPLTDILRAGARKLLAQAIEIEAEAYLASMRELKLPDGRVRILVQGFSRAKVEYFVKSALESGATLVTGGKRPEHLQKGFYYEPTLFDNVDPKSEIAQNEIFGPVGVVMGFDTDEEAIRIANESDFGLAGGIITADPAEGYRMALRLRTGTVWLNGGFGSDMSSHAPFGGYKRSGIGKEYGPRWIDEYLNEKVISFPIGKL